MPSPASTGAAAAAAQDGRFAELRDRKEWKQFKKLWQELDAVTPVTAAGGVSYARSIDRSRSEALSTRVAQTLRELEQAKALSSDEVQFFRQAASTRIENMLRGSDHLMMMHRLPPPLARDRFASVDRLERRIDALLELRKQGSLGTQDHQLALKQVEDEAVTLYVTQALGGAIAPIGPPPVRGTSGEQMLAQLEQKLAEARADGGVTDERLVNVVAKAKTMVPVVRSLIAELER